jgi:hypothetical protein
MFEDILGKDKRHVDIIIWILEIDGENHCVEVFKAVENDRGVMEGYIKNTTLKVNNYTNYRMSIPTPTRHFFKVLMIRVNKHTIKFYVPEGK